MKPSTAATHTRNRHSAGEFLPGVDLADTALVEAVIGSDIMLILAVEYAQTDFDGQFKVNFTCVQGFHSVLEQSYDAENWESPYKRI